MTDNFQKCPHCGSENVIFSKKMKSFVCEDCERELGQEKPVIPMRIFLSYGHDGNEDLVRRIYADLKKRGHDVWFDKTEIKFGHEWRRAITDGILRSNRVLSFLSKYSTRDPGVCLDEIAIAIGAKGGNIQTILVENEREVKPPPSISHIQWLDMHDWKERRTAGEAAWEPWYQTKLAEIVAVVESDESRRFAGEIKTLEELLKPTVSDFASDARIRKLLEKKLVGRTWLFEAVENWRNTTERDSKLFWLMGAPGIGKSAFAAHLAHEYGRGTVIAIQFCDWKKPDHRDASRIIRTLAFQMATRLPDYRKLLLTLPIMTELDRKNSAELFDGLLTNPLKLSITGGRERYLIVIDALDEAGGDGRNELVEVLARYAGQLPDWIGLVVTSRPEFDVTTPFQALKPFPFETKSAANSDDIRAYLRRELAAQLQNRPDADRLVEQILEKSEGVFLYVESFCEDIRKNHLSLDRPNEFPQGLAGKFYMDFQRYFPDLEKFRKDVRSALRAILAAREPLPVEILQRLFNWPDEELRDFTRPLASIFPVTTEVGRKVIKLHHKSLADWLENEGKAGPYFVSHKEGHRMLADYSRVWWSQDSYALAHLPYHLAWCQEWAALSSLLINAEFISTKRARLGYASLAQDYKTVDEYHFPMTFTKLEFDLFRSISDTVKGMTGFSGRRKETSQVEDLLLRSQPQHIVVTGLSGIGKTSFLTNLWLGNIDRRVLITLGPTGRFDSLRGVERFICESVARYFHIAQSSWNSVYPDPGEGLHVLSEHLPEGTCLIVDEMDAALTSWEDAAREFAFAKCRFVWGTRAASDILQFFGNDAYRIELSSLSRAEVADYIRHEMEGKVSEADLDRWITLTEGMPLALHLLAAQVKQTGSFGEVSPFSPHFFRDVLNQTLLKARQQYSSLDLILRPLVMELVANRSVLWVDFAKKHNFTEAELVALEKTKMFSINRNGSEITVSAFHLSVLEFLKEVFGVKQ